MSKLAGALLLLVLASTGPGLSAASAPDRTITKNSVGPVRLGMTVAQARRALPAMKLKRTTDGEGLALIEVTEGKTSVMTLYAGEENPERPIKEGAKIEYITVHDSRYAMPDGTHPGMPLRDAEKKYGKILRIYRSEMEMREYADFPKPPSGFTLQLGTAADSGEAGAYAEGTSEAKRYTPRAIVLNISIPGGLP